MVEITKFQKPFFAEFMVVLNCGWDNGAFVFCVFHGRSRGAQDADNIRKTGFVVVVGAPVQFSFDRSKLSGSGAF